VVVLKVIVFLAAVVAAGAGCFSPPQPACAFSCAENGDCPSGYSCADDGVCHREGDQRSCDIPPQTDGGDPDAGS
jgi:hypothetical protein